MPIQTVLQHFAIPLKAAEEGEWVEGERDVADEEDRRGTAFACALFLPAAGGEDTVPRGRRTVTRPQLLWDGTDEEGGEVALSPADEVLVVAPELNIAEGLVGNAEVRYTVEGRPQAFGRPGRTAVGLQVTVKRVDD